MPNVTAKPNPPKNFQVAGPPKKKEERAQTNSEPTLQQLMAWDEFSMEAAQKKHQEWFVIDQFIRGNHDIRGNKYDNSIEIHRSSRISFPTNLVYATFRAVRGYVTRHKPKTEIDIQETTDEAKAYARRANRVLERDNQLNNARRINKEWVYYGVKYGVGYRQVGYDAKKKCCMRWSIDPFDLTFGTKNGKMEDAPYVIKHVVRSMEYIKNKFKDWAKDISPDNELAASEWKTMILQMQFDTDTTSSEDEGKQTVILKECWYRVFDKNKNGGFVNKVYFTDKGRSPVEETPFSEYPFIPYEAEILPNEPFPDGHIKHIISPQKMFNMLNTQELEYNHITNRGRFQTEKNSGFRVVNTKEGQIILVNQGKRLQVLNPPSINANLPNQRALALQMIRDIGGQSDATRGIAPYSGASGSAIEQLQNAGSNDINDLRDNFEDALSQEAAWILKMYSLFESDGIVMTDNSQQEPDKFGAIGAGAYQQQGKEIPERYLDEGGSYCDVCAILPDNQVKVSVISELGETKEAQQEILFKLLEAGLPLKTVLEHLEFPNTNDLMERIASEQAASIIENQMMGPQTPPQVPMPGQPQAQGVDESDMLNQLQSLMG